MMKTVVLAFLDSQVGRFHLSKAMRRRFIGLIFERRTFSSIAKIILNRNWTLPLEEQWLGWLIAATLVHSRLSKRDMVKIALEIFLPIEKQVYPCMVGAKLPIKMIQAYLEGKPVRKISDFGPEKIGKLFLCMSENKHSLRVDRYLKTDSQIHAQAFAIASLGRLLLATTVKSRTEIAEAVTLSIISRVYCEATLRSEEPVPMAEIRTVFSPIIDLIQKSI